MNTTQRIVFRNGYEFIFYDNEENDDVQNNVRLHVLFV